MIIEIVREDDSLLKHNFGQMYIDDAYFGETLEDKDRYMEADGVKVPKDTAIPRGRYTVILSHSNRFKRITPEVLEVPGFTAIRIHGGNTEADTEGCPLLGSIRTATGVSNCLGINNRLIDIIGETIAAGEEVFLVVS